MDYYTYLKNDLDNNELLIEYFLLIFPLYQIKKINIQDEKFSSEDLAKIRNITEGPRDKFLEACKKKDKSIKSEYDLPKKDRKKYDLLDEREIRFNATYDYKLAGDTIEDILEKRRKKKGSSEYVYLGKKATTGKGR